MKKNELKFSFDLGTNSIGWAVFELNRKKISGLIKSGVRLFPDGRDRRGESLAVERRIARGKRRCRDRLIKRSNSLIENLIKMGLMPSDELARKNLKGLEVYKLRSDAISRELKPSELGRAIYHLNKRRGFKSSRKLNSKSESKINGPRILGLENYLKVNNFKTIGMYLNDLKMQKKPLRFKPSSEHYPDRKLYINEFKAIQEFQEKFHKLSPENWQKLYNIIFYQRPLKSSAELVGKCELYPTEKRTTKSSIYFQRFNLIQTLSNLKIIDQEGEKREISIDEKLKLYENLSCKEKITFDSIRKELSLDKNFTFNLEDNKRKEIKGDKVSTQLKKCLGKDYNSLSISELDLIVEILESEIEDIKTEMNNFNFNELKIIELTEIALPKGYCSLSKKALKEFVEDPSILFKDPGAFQKKIIKNSGENSQKDHLVYYGEVLISSVVGAGLHNRNDEGRFGKISNPTVHIALNQLRKVVNELIDMYGKPDEVAIEVTRDLKNSREKKDIIIKTQRINNENNERISKIISKQHKIPIPSREDILKYKLWEELGGNDVNDRKCPYSLKNIPAQKLFTNEIAIEHILPFSRTLDDSFSNKTLSYNAANRQKGNRSPFEAFGENKNYEDILLNAKKFSKNKQWRFFKDAMEKFEEENKFLSRQLNDTAYISKIAKKYLETICSKVYTIPGMLTSKVRHHLGLNKILNYENNIKDRSKSTKHHAIDAIVVGLITRSFLQKIANQSKVNAIKIDIEEPFKNFRLIVQKSIDEIAVSRKEDNGIQARFHEETNYGIIKNPNKYEEDNGYNIVTRKSLSELKLNDIEKIRSLDIRNKFAEIKNTQDDLLKETKFKKIKEKLKKSGVMRIRFLKKDISVTEITHPAKSKLFYRGVVPGDNHSLEVWKMPNTQKIEFVVYSYFEKNIGKCKKPHPAAKKLFTLCKGDNVELLDEEKKSKIYMNVRIIGAVGKLVGLVPLEAAKRDDSETTWFSFSKFAERKLMKIKITECGKILSSKDLYV